ncbi:MAG: HepT-like ribonuclease domain-containing protein [Acidimicrobiia bacterium]
MSRSDAYRLADMLMAADEIAAIVQRGRDAFDEDVVLRRAVERCLEIIGEASKAVSEALTAAHPEIPWSDMAKVRDRLSHHYHRIDPSQLWVIATGEIPAVAELLRSVEAEE